jgi:hypothetical protein
MLLRVALVEKYINHFEYPFPKQMFHPAIEFNIIIIYKINKLLTEGRITRQNARS